jgi:hypothetical protein
MSCDRGDSPAATRLTAMVCALQSVMIDIVVMLFTIIRSYFPSELRWTAVLTVSVPCLSLCSCTEDGCQGWYGHAVV